MSEKKYALFESSAMGRRRSMVTFDTSDVEMVEETENRVAYGGWQETAIIHFKSGRTIEVYDYGRTVAHEIMEAKSVPERDERKCDVSGCGLTKVCPEHPF